MLELHREAIYEAKPCGIAGQDADFGLNANGTTYLFFHDIKRGGGKKTEYTFTGIDKKVNAVTWLDQEENLAFTQSMAEKTLTVAATPFPYGKNLIVRVAKLS